MYVHPDAVINTFIDVKIPDSTELLKRFGLKAPSGHPDRVSDEIYSHPSNIHDVQPFDKFLHEADSFLNQFAEDAVVVAPDEVNSEDNKSDFQTDQKDAGA